MNPRREFCRAALKAFAGICEGTDALLALQHLPPAALPRGVRDQLPSLIRKAQSLEGQLDPLACAAFARIERLNRQDRCAKRKGRPAKAA